jgi:hypothetical protein
LNILLQDPGSLARMGQAGLQFVSDNQGATERAVMHIKLALNQVLYNEIVSSQVKSTS